DIKRLNSYLDSVLGKVYEKQQELLIRNLPITALTLKNAYLGIDIRKKTILEAIKLHNKNMNKLIGKDYAKSTHIKYETTKKHIEEFIKIHYGREDLFLIELNYQFINQFHSYLRTEKNIGNNCTNKYLTNLKKIMNWSINHGWIEKNPFHNFKLVHEEVKKDFLTEEELIRIKETKIDSERLTQIRDVFVFCCHTGLAYSDVKKLSKDHLMRSIDGEYWIQLNRTKTKNQATIPLLKSAKVIIEKYKDRPDLMYENRLLPVVSNQKMNAYLKEIALLCGIDKKLTSHIGRHTFATNALTNRVPLETVGKLLGNKSIKSTQIYAKITNNKILDDVEYFKQKWNNNDNPNLHKTGNP
ncbi:MAG: site-specific integrase, partial [Promethearchaeota archaeon]